MSQGMEMSLQMGREIVILYVQTNSFFIFLLLQILCCTYKHMQLYLNNIYINVYMHQYSSGLFPAIPPWKYL